MSRSLEYLPRATGGREPRAPLFPLSNVWLFPGTILPLHIFEPRYRQMIEDSLDGPGTIVLGTVAEGHENEMPGSPPVYRLAGLGKIDWHERLPDGRFLIKLVGVQRVDLCEVESQRLYRQVGYVTVAERTPSADEEAELRPRVLAALEARTGKCLQLPPGLPLSRLTDWLVLRLPLPHRCVQALFGELDTVARARGALAEHEQRGKPPTC